MRKRHTFFEIDEHDSNGLINLTPLLDVLFVVLIFFILISPMLDIDHINLANGKQETLDLQGPALISLHVFKNNTIELNKKVTSIKDLEEALIVLNKAYPKEIPQIYHDREASFGTYQAIKNSLEKAGFDQMDVILRAE
jgi:biopolymer transport protein ExbD